MKRCALLLSLMLGIAQTPGFALDINSRNRIGQRAGIRVSAYPWAVPPPVKAPQKNLEDNEIAAQDIEDTDILNDKFAYFLPRQKALIGVTFTYLVVEPVEEKADVPAFIQAVCDGLVKGLGLSEDDENKAQVALSLTLTTSKNLDDLDDVAKKAVTPTSLSDSARKKAEQTLKQRLDRMLHADSTLAYSKQLIADGGARFSDFGFAEDEPTTSSDADGTGGTAAKPPGNTGTYPGGQNITDIKGLVSIDKPVTFKLVAFPDQNLGFVADYSHAYPLTADLKHGMINISESGIITGVNSEQVDQTPAIVTDVAVAAIDIAKAVATWGASGLFSGGGGGGAKPKTATKPLKLSPDMDAYVVKTVQKAPKKKRLKITNAFDITVQQLVDLKPDDAVTDICEFVKKIDFTCDVNNLLQEKGIEKVENVPLVLLAVRSPNKFAMHFGNLKSHNLLDGCFVEGVVLRQPQTVRFTLSTTSEALTDVEWQKLKVLPNDETFNVKELVKHPKKHPHNDEDGKQGGDPASVTLKTLKVCPATALPDPPGRILYDDYAQLAQTGTLTAVSLRTKGSRDGAKSITLTAAGGIKSVDETTTSSLKPWADALKAIAGAL